MGDNKRVWDRYARIYDLEVNLYSRAAYRRMYSLMSSALSSDMTVLEVATGTGLIAINIARYVRSVTATDFSPAMIATASRKKTPPNVSFSVEDATSLPFADGSFDAVIISNALHVMPDPAQALAQARRVLREGGLLIAPSFSHGHLSDHAWSLNARLLALIGFEAYSRWTPEEYVGFIESNGFHVGRWQVLRAAFPLVYLEARPTRVSGQA